ncbi:MAG: YHS domain-containing (seleno)protein [Pseudomonadota bacterium]
MTAMTRRFALAIGAAAVATPALAGKDAVFTNWLGYAIRGYDPVAYHKEGRPVEGSSDFTHDWQGATWSFASADNRDLFAADPEAYAPQFGGYCAWAVSQGYTAPVDPNAWDIIDGKLYLNYNTDIQSRWRKDIPGHIASATANWPGILN